MPATLPIDSIPHNGKRKRDAHDNNTQVNGNVSEESKALEEARIRTTIALLTTALSRYDTSPSILKQSLATSHTNSNDSAPASKRTKLSNAVDEGNTVSDKAQQEKYRSLDDFLSDIEEAATRMQASVSSQQNDATTSQWKYQPDSLEADRVSAQLRTFRKALRTFILQEHGQPETEQPSVKKEKDLPNGDVKTEDSASNIVGEEMTDGQGKAVLTLFGNAQGQHKQLFSSFQKPMPRHLWSDAQGAIDSSPDALMPLRENGLLGNQIISTKLVPVEGRDALTAAKRDLQFRDLFSPPSSLPALTPPKPASSSTNRSPSITWTSTHPASEPSQKQEYATEKLPSGQWLGYDGLSTEQGTASPEAKRRRRDRALSSGEATREQPNEMRAALARAKEDALFRRVYSSFAPTADNSACIIPEETKNDLWWAHFAGVQNANSVAIDPFLDNEAIDEDDAAVDGDPDSYKDVVENFEPTVLEPQDAGGSENPDLILVEISELLESLQSHQRVRNSHLNAGARLGTGQVPASNSGTAPSEAEISLYNKSRSKLASLVSRLSPYTVAKVQGDELGDLVLSREILLEGSNYQGTMDDDQATRMAAAAALNVALGGSSASRNTPASKQNTYSHARTSSGPVNASTPNNTVRNSSSVSKPPLSNWQTTAQSHGASAQRPAYNPVNSYNRAPLNSYTNPRPLAAQTNGMSTSYQQSPSQPMYQQRAQIAVSQYGGYAQSPTLGRPPPNLQSIYQPIMSRPPSNGYSSATAGAPQASMTTSNVPPRPTTQGSSHSPLPQGSPYAPPQSTMGVNGTSQASRPITPSGLNAAQTQTNQQPQQSPSVTAAPSQAMTTSSSSGTPMPPGSS